MFDSNSLKPINGYDSHVKVGDEKFAPIENSSLTLESVCYERKTFSIIRAVIISPGFGSGKPNLLYVKVSTKS